MGREQGCLFPVLVPASLPAMQPSWPWRMGFALLPVPYLHTGKGEIQGM